MKTKYPIETLNEDGTKVIDFGGLSFKKGMSRLLKRWKKNLRR